MTLFDAWAGSHERRRAAIARGAALFNAKPDRHHGRRRPERRPRRARDPGLLHDLPRRAQRRQPLGRPADRHRPDRRVAPHAGHAAVHPAEPGHGRDPQDDRPRPRPADRQVGGHRQVQGPGPPRPRRAAAVLPQRLAADLGEVVDFYNTRFAIGFTDRRRPTWSRSSRPSELFAPSDGPKGALLLLSEAWTIRVRLDPSASSVRGTGHLPRSARDWAGGYCDHVVDRGNPRARVFHEADNTGPFKNWPCTMFSDK